MRIRNIKGCVLWQKWINIPNYVGLYKVSTLGKVKSLSNKFSKKGKILKFWINQNGYSTISLSKNGIIKHKKVHQLMAIVFLNHTPDGYKLVVDHKNGDKLNNRRNNIQIVTNRENVSTCFKKNKNQFTSRFVGVSYDKNRAKWQVQIKVNCKSIFLGRFDDEIEASDAYQTALQHLNNGSIDEYLELKKPKFSSKYKGVRWDKDRNKWVSSIMVNGRNKYLGRFLSEIDASNAYQKALSEL